MISTAIHHSRCDVCNTPELLSELCELSSARATRCQPVLRRAHLSTVQGPRNMSLSSSRYPSRPCESMKSRMWATSLGCGPCWAAQDSKGSAPFLWIPQWKCHPAGWCPNPWVYLSCSLVEILFGNRQKLWWMSMFLRRWFHCWLVCWLARCL